MITKPAHLLRWLTRTHEQPRRLCTVCIRQSRHHPAGLRRNYTRSRLHGYPVCERHSNAEAIQLLRFRIGGRPCD